MWVRAMANDGINPKRQAIPKSVRFEVFKRDGFTCQYCGAKAPNVVLHVDHIHPVAGGGDNNIMNLITSCFSCNSGKSDRTLDDNSVIERQRSQIDDLNERRQQLEMMVEWRNGLMDINDQAIEAFQKVLERLGGFRANDVGVADIRKWLLEYNYDELTQAAATSFAQYIQYENGQVTEDSWARAFLTIPSIAKAKKHGTPAVTRAYYARGILRKRLNYLNDGEVVPMILRAVESGVDVENIVAVAKECRTWTQFQNSLNYMMYGDEDGSN